MRKSITIIFVLLFMNTSYGQKWITPGAEWRFIKADIGGYTIVSAKLGVDTIINTKPCQSILLNSFGNIETYYTLQSNDTIYFFLLGQFRPSIYLNAEIGDTLNLFNPNFSNFENCSVVDSFLRFRVDSVYYSQIDTLLLKTFNLQVTYNLNGFISQSIISYIERIGFASNIYPNFYCSLEETSYFLCSYKDNEINWQKSNCSVGINDLNSTETAIYPNPISLTLFIKTGNCMNQKIHFFDVVGREIFSTEIQSPETQIDVSNWQRGVYFYSISKDGVSQQNGKIVLE
jgi:hypothetical protein